MTARATTTHGVEATVAPVVTVHDLTKHYGPRVAVDELSLSIPRGVVAGFIGPNGAGKTTTMAMLLGLVRPTSGTGAVLGRSLDDPAAYLSRVGALVEAPAFWPALTGEENLRVLATLAGQDSGRIPGVLEQVRLDTRGADRFGQYSFGMKQRLGIAAALLGDPELRILDEPTNGLDPAGISEMRELITEIASKDSTVLVSSHILSELEHVCDWLILIEHGSLVFQGPAATFLALAAPVIDVAPERHEDLDRLDDLVRAEGLDTDQGAASLVVHVDGDDERALAAALNRLAMGAGIALSELHVRRPTLESNYLAAVQGGHR
jgi:ABC-2 type transport system ATP-binding protein